MPKPTASATSSARFFASSLNFALRCIRTTRPSNQPSAATLLSGLGAGYGQAVSCPQFLPGKRRVIGGQRLDQWVVFEHAGLKIVLPPSIRPFHGVEDSALAVGGVDLTSGESIDMEIFNKTLEDIDRRSRSPALIIPEITSVAEYLACKGPSPCNTGVLQGVISNLSYGQ